MTRDQARTFMRTWAQTQTAPALDTAEEEFVLDQARIADDLGFAPGTPGYVDTYWGTRAVVLALDLRVTKASVYTDYTTDGTSASASQTPEQLTKARASWRSRLTPGSV